MDNILIATRTTMSCRWNFYKPLLFALWVTFMPSPVFAGGDFFYFGKNT